MNIPVQSDPCLIRADHLTVFAGGRAIVEDVHLSVHKGEIVVLIGPNGSGKTTLLRALQGLIPSRGSVTKRPELRIGYVPQIFARDPSLPLTVRRLMRLGGANQPDADAALARIGIGQLAEAQVATLSGGEMARVLLARAVARKPDLLILDEPLAGVDVQGEAALYHLIAELRDELGCGVLLVSHDLHIVMAEATRVICLNRHICCEGTPEAVIRSPEFAHQFGDRAARELAVYTHVHNHSHDISGHSHG